MRTFQTLSLATLSMLMISCGNNTPSEAEQTDERFVEKIDEKTGIASLQEYSDSSDITIGEKDYRYKFDFHHVDSLPHIKYEATGAEYYDNEVILEIKRGDEPFVKKTFTKSSFKSYVPEKLWKTSGLIGFTYNIDRRLSNKNDAFYFIATIGNLDDAEEIAYSLEIRIDTDGGMLINKYEELETQPISNGLTIDPSADDGV